MRFRALWLCLAVLIGCQRERPVGAVLEYELEAESISKQADIDYAAIVAVVDRYLNARQRLGEVSLADGDTIEVGVFGGDPRDVDKVKQRLESLGTLELRIVADRHADADLIKTALELPTSQRRVEAPDGTLMARWVPVQRKAFEPIMTLRDTFALREPGHKQLEVLVKIDPFHVTGEYISRAAPGARNDIPCIEFEFNKQGAALFGALTGANLPDPDAGRDSAMGIIVNGTLMTAPHIKSVITDRGEITGNFTFPEVQALAAALGTGGLPAPLRLVRERAPNKP